MKSPRTWLPPLLALLLTACDAPGWVDSASWRAWLPFSASEPETIPEGVAPTATPSLQFLIWPVAPAEIDFLQAALDDFNRQNAGPPAELVIAPDYDRRLTAPEAGERPADLFLVTGNRLPQFIAENLLAPLPADESALASVVPGLLPGFGVGDRAFCHPRDVHTLAVVYNPALFDRTNTPYPAPGWTWSDFASAAEGATDQDFFIFGLTLNPDLSRMAVFMLQAGGGWVDTATGAPRFTDSASQFGMEFFIERFRAGQAVYDTTLDSIWPGEAFGRGSAGMTLEGSWILPFLDQEFPRLRFSTAELPRGPAGQTSLAFTTCLGVNPNSPQRTRALALAQYLTRADIAAEWRSYHGGMPVIADEIAAWQSVDPARVPFAAAVSDARVWQLPLGWEHLPEFATPLIRSTIARDIDVATLAQRLQSAAQTE